MNHFILKINFKIKNDSVLFPLYFKIEESTKINFPIVLQFYIILPKAIRSLTIILSEEDRLCDEINTYSKSSVYIEEYQLKESSFRH